MGFEPNAAPRLRLAVAAAEGELDEILSLLAPPSVSSAGTTPLPVASSTATVDLLPHLLSRRRPAHARGTR